MAKHIVSKALPLNHYEASKALEKLEQIFANVPDGCTDVRLGVRVWYGSKAGADMYTLTDYLYYGDGRTRVRFTEREAQQQFTQVQLSAVTEKHGWAMGQPTRRSTTELVYTFTPDTGQHRFGLHSATVQSVERQRQERVFNAFHAFS